MYRRKPVNDYRIDISNQLNYHINDNEAFKGRYKNGPEGDFTRNRLLPFGHLIISILRVGKSGLQREMDSFFKETENEQFSIRKVTKSAFSKSRQELAPEAFRELNDLIWKDFYKKVDYFGYHGHKLLSVDGSFLNLPNHPSVHEEFGRRGMGRGKKKDLPKSMCLLSALYDPANYLTLDVQTGPTDGSEQDLLLKHLPKVERGDILLMDRGYPTTALFSGLQSKGIYFIVRMKQNWLPVKEFMASRKRDTIVTLTVPDGYYDSYQEEFPSMKKEIKCRLVKITLENGKEEILGTSLLDSAKYKLPELGELYQIRWGAEEGYKMYKARVQVEAFSGKTATAVRQDIYAKVMMMTLCAALAFPIEERVIAECNAEKQKGEVKHRRKINRTFAYWSTKCILIAMFIKKTIKSALVIFDQQVAANTEVIRPGRHNKRKRRPPKLYHMNYKDV
ncbi:MAG TPA: IS4 family transposase [Puia sp.]